MLHVDLERREIVASVRGLIDRTPRPASWLSRARLAWGMEVHRRYRREREAALPDFRGEVTVSLQHEVDGFRATVRGRVDGLIRRGNEICVEEVKSARTPTPEHRLQLRLYALCLARAHPGATVRTRLVMVEDQNRDGWREIDTEFDAERTARQLDGILRACIAEAQRTQQRRARAPALAFPHRHLRPGQQRLMDAVAQGLEEKRPVLAEAPTGIGKTVSVLLPALRFAAQENALLFFATAKTTQQALVARTFENLAPAPLRALTLRAKARMCPADTLFCHPEHCRYLANYLHADRRRAVLDRLIDNEPAHISPDAIYGAGRDAVVCPHALSMALLREVDLVIGDYNYAFAPHSNLDLSPCVAVVDEAHNLFDRMREHHSPYLARAAVADPLTAWRFPPAAPLLRKLDAALADADLQAGSWEVFSAEASRLIVEYAGARGLIEQNDPLVAVLSSVSRIHELLAGGEPEFVPYANEDGTGVLCVNPARRLKQRHEQCVGTVAMSATLSPLPHYAEVLGFAALDPLQVRLPSPFPAEHRCVLIDAGVRTTYRERSRHYDGIAERIERLAGVRAGHYVAYFPSFHFLEAVRARLKPDGLLAQKPKMSLFERDQVLARLRTDPAPLLLLAVLGGIFAEGVDLPGEALVGAIVVGPGLPPVGFERTAMRRYFDETTGQGFTHAMLVPGMQRAIQAAGRVPRTPDDRGIIALLDARFAKPPYADHLPPEWGRYGAEELVAEDPVAVLERFWEDAGPVQGRAIS